MSKSKDELEQLLSDLSVKIAEARDSVQYCLKLLDWVPDEEDDA